MQLGRWSLFQVMSSVILVPVWPVDPSHLSVLTDPIRKIFSVPVKILPEPPLENPSAFNFSRNQYNSTSILSTLLEKFGGVDGKILGVTGGDLFVPVLTYVFGEAQLEGKAAVVSSHRLHEEFYGLRPDQDLFNIRLVKEAVHELGHTFGLIHCANYLCVMHTSTGVEEIDIKTERLCADCREKLSSAIH